MEIELHPFQSWNLCSVWYMSYNPFMKTSKTKSFVFKLTLWCLLNLLNFLAPIKHWQWLFRMFTGFNIATLNSTHSSLNKWHTLNSFFKVYIHTQLFKFFWWQISDISLMMFFWLRTIKSLKSMKSLWCCPMAGTFDSMTMAINISEEWC